MAVVHNNDVGNKTATRNPGRSMIERLARTDSPLRLRIEAPNTVRIKRSANCGAMSQQNGDSGNYLDAAKIRPAGGLP